MTAPRQAARHDRRRRGHCDVGHGRQHHRAPQDGPVAHHRLVENAAAFACEILNPGGVFLAKVFQSGAEADLLAQLKRDFTTVKHVKPAASRQDSSERYLLALGFRGDNGVST